MKKLARFLFDIDLKPDQILPLERMKLGTFYIIALISVPAVGMNLYFTILQKFQGTFYLWTLCGFMGFQVLGLIAFWKTRRLFLSQVFMTAAFLLVMAQTFITGGGVHGFGIFYFFTLLPVMYLLFGMRLGLFLSLVNVFGIAIRLSFGHFSPPSIYAEPGVVSRVLVLLFISTALGLISNFSLQSFVHRIIRLAYVDPATGLPNRARFIPLLKEATQRVKKAQGGLTLVGIKILNLDRINAHLSTQAGDELLVSLAKRLAASLGPDRHFGRWSGSLFLVAIETLDPAQIQVLCKDLQGALNLSFPHPKGRISFEWTLAVCRYPDDGYCAEDLVGHVLSLCDKQRNKPGEIGYFSQQNLGMDRNRFQIAEGLAQAHFDREFSLVYQPKLRIADRQCIGAEILIRWVHPQLGPVSPALFIPIAEETGTIRRLSRWVLARVFRDLTAEDLPAPLHNPRLVHAVNLSVADLRDPDLIPFIRREIQSTGFHTSGLEFEITEGMLVDQDPQVKDNLDSLKEMGFRIAIDDFGTGYSSLSYLHHIRAENLKIDRSFIEVISPENQSGTFPVVDAIISMGHALGLEITAEGVETPFQAHYLASRGCQMAQGWLYSKGVPLVDYIDFLRIHSAADKVPAV